MTDALDFISSLIAGLLLGAFFFGGLWWTVRKGLKSQRAALWFFGSMLLRTGVVMLGFYWLLGDSWQRMLVGLLGFFIARLLVTWLTREAEQPGPLVQEADHES
ncbi:MAG: ATPase F0F1 [Gammaproteobacteria bacterium]|nr:ATPase F0F1 [Gammaproteobacteria bacterium]MBU1480067.1 ATPase F0F1 [Gammaproteobacteria bacterium]